MNLAVCFFAHSELFLFYNGYIIRYGNLVRRKHYGRQRISTKIA